MSQEKVDRYKEQKRNRKAIQAKKKREAFFTKLCAGLIAIHWLCGLDILSCINMIRSRTAVM